MTITLEDIFSSQSIKKRAEEAWNEKSQKEKQASASKYSHIIEKFHPKYVNCSWDKNFNELSKPQRVILTKGELIRTYDSLSNHDKTKVKNKLKLRIFGTKWYKLLSEDKQKLLKYVIN